MKNQKLNVFIARGEFADDFETYRKAAEGHYLDIQLMTNIFKEDSFKREDLFAGTATSNLIIEPEFRIITTKSLAEMMQIAEEADDLHVIFDTMNHEDLYDGYREMTSAKDEWYEEQMKSEVKSDRYVAPKIEDELMMDKIFEIERDVHNMMLDFTAGTELKYLSSYLARRICFAAITSVHESNAYEQIGILDYVKDDIKQDWDECNCE